MTHLINKYFRAPYIRKDVSWLLISLKVLVGILLFSAPLSLSAQHISLDNYTGNWSGDGTWVSGTAPGTSNLNDDVRIYGFVSRFGSLDFNNGNPYVYDTLVIYGDLTLGNNADLEIGPSAILIVRGNYTSGNQVEVTNGGVMVVTGEWIMTGADNQGAFDNDGQLYIFDPVPNLKTGSSYDDLNCVDCILGYEDLITSEFGDFFLSGSYEISLSGPAEFCFGDSVILSTTDTGTDYQWYLNDAEIPGENSDSLTVFSSGDYHVSFKVDADSFALGKVTATVYPLPLVTIEALEAGYCAGAPQDTIYGLPEGGVFNPSPDYMLLGGDSVLFSPVSEGAVQFTYVYTDGYGCTDSVTAVTTVHALPVADILGVDPEGYCEGSMADTLVGNPSGGEFLSGAGLTILGLDSAVFDPAAAGSFDIYYTYTNGNGCTDTALVTAMVHALPEVSIAGTDTFYCVGEVADTITGLPAGGTFLYSSGFSSITTDSVLFDPSADGNYNLRYVYSDVNGCIDSVDITIVVYPLPVLSVSGLLPNYCANSPIDTIEGNLAPEGLFSGDEINDLGNGTAEFTIGAPGIKDVYYTLTDINGCIDTALLQTEVFALPVVSFIGLDSLYDVSDPSATITGSPFGGIFSGPGITGDQFDPAGAGVGAHEIIYTYTDGNGCLNSDTLLTEVRDYDFMAGARIIPSIDNWCSLDAGYTTIGATADEPKPDCWNDGPAYNRWFMFQATTEEVNVVLKTGGDEGSLRRPRLALWDSTGNLLACQEYISDYEDITMGAVGIVPGEWYFISVDNDNSGGYRGTFTLCVDDQVDYDFREGAVELPHFSSWCSAEAVYTTLSASADRDAGSCWVNGPTYNRWFKFRATAGEVAIDVKTGGTEGTIRRIQVAVWDSTGNELACKRYSSDYDDVRIQYVGLTPGDWYYISVDNHQNSGYRGTFTVCLDTKVDYDFREGAIEIADPHDWCSADAAFTTFEATPDQLKGSNWNTGPNYNRWFRFRATTNEVKADLKTGGDLGSLRYGYIALWDSAGNEISSARYYSEYGDIFTSSVSLIPGDLYYISVDNYSNTGYQGTFTLCVADSIGYDFKEGAVRLPSTDGWCSENAEYTTIGATSDRLAGSNWNSGPNYNRWFSFTATSNQLTASVLTGGDFGTLRYGYIAIWDELDNEIISARYYAPYDEVRVSTVDLVPGQTYYISVDNLSNTGYRGTFTLCVDDTVDYDFREAAEELTDLDYWCSPLQAYTTIAATPDGERGTAWNSGPNFNRWFRFRATREFVKVDLLTGGDEGSLRYGYLALWDSTGNEITSARYNDDYSDITVSAPSLTPGEWYYVSVDNLSNTGYRGTFSLCITDTIDYDFKEAALEVPHTSDWCSAEAAYTTIGATPDRLPGSAWNSGPNYNRWFKFQATTSLVRAELKTGGLEGSLRYGYIAIFNENDVELASARYTSDYSDVSVGSDSLIVGNWYYIAVDHLGNLGYRGTFTLCVTDTVDYDFKMAAVEVNINGGWCSSLQAFTTIDATPDELRGSTWNSGPNYNRWFKFTAPGTIANVVVKTGGDEGSLRYPFVAIWSEEGTEVASTRYIDDYSDINTASDTLAPGQTYYVSVDNHSNPGYRGTFSLCIYDTIDYDFKSGAFEITNYDNWCSGLQEFTTVGASADELRASCWNSGPNFNRWFKFRAVSTDFTAVLRTGGSYGTLRSPLLALYDSAGNEKACSRYINDYQDIEITTDTFDLVNGDWYYIVVDNYEHTNRRGTFTLCTDDKLSYDFKDGAETITDLDNWCSDLAQFSTVTATPDESRPSCWPNGPNYNRWFRFQATTTSVSAHIRTYGAEGDVDRLMVALWDDMLNEVDCNIYQVNESDVEVSSTTLSVGNWYYISVDNYSGTGYRGTFTVCLKDQLVNDFKAGAIELSDFNGWCSADALYTNSIATADEAQGSCWTGGENRNVWFKFNPNSSNVAIVLKTGGISGSMTNPQMALWDAAGNELECTVYSGSDTLTINATSLNPGEEYFISVDDDGTSGTFSLCLDDDVIYDYPPGAYELTDISDWCSPDAGFANSTVPEDTRSGNCWTGSTFKNAWFKFLATGKEIKISVTTGGAFGSMQRQQIGLWNIMGDEVGCSVWTGNTGTVVLQSDSLTAGNWYWIGIDDDRNSGSFTICIDDETDFDYRRSAYEITDLTQWCSADEAFSNIHATADEAAGSCWTGTENKNVWFNFTAETPFAKISVKTGTVYGNMQRQQIALFNEADVEVGCAVWSGNQGTVILQTDTLTVGHSYWFSVDDDRVSSSFTICTDDSPDYDYKAGAYELTDISNWCSANEQFSNFWATADEAMGSCWGGTENKNVWFRFTASNRFINIRLRTGNVYGDMRRPQMALWRDDGTEVACAGPVINYGTLELSADTLTAGHVYYLSVDDNRTSNDFTLCIDDQPTFDYREGAVELAHDAGCSAEEAYTNYHATADQSMGSCWSGTENKNVWFKFRANTPYLTLRLKTGTVYGTMRRGQMAVWREDGMEVKCVGRIVDYGTTVMSIDTLTVDDWYYISVDDDRISGSFTLCIEDELNYDFWDGARVLSHDEGCSPDAAYTNYYATDDETMAPCWSGTENKNVWFTFQATSPFITVTLKNGNIYGSQRRGQMALWNSNKEVIQCVGPVNYEGTTVMSLDTLTVGEWYWISVDDNNRAGSFTLCIEDAVGYDYKAGAVEVPHAEWCSADAAYTNIDATNDELMGSCWSGTLNKNVWFRFLATGPEVTVSLKTGNIFGSLRRGQMAIWNENGDEMKCVGRLVDRGTTTMSIDSLTAGNWYYISVDDDYVSGSFSLCMSDKADYDYKAGAVEVQHRYGCYPETGYSNYQATDDGSQGSCWTGEDNKNVWFRFQAENEELRVRISTGTVYGSMRRQQVALWDASDNEIACATWVNNTGSVIMQTDALTVGDWYYLSVDDDRTSGSFTMCISDSVDFDYHDGALVLTDVNNYCSADGEFSNLFATADRQQGSCWTGTENKNVWFRLTAITSNLLVKVKTGTVYGSMRRQQVSVWNESGVEVGCARWTTNTGTVTLSLDTLTAGNNYYISVDDDLTSGTFTLCVQGNPLAADISGTDVTCHGENDGTVNVLARGGTQTGYGYSWTFDGVPMIETGSSLTGLGPGVYAVTVTDDGDPATTISRSFTVSEDPPLLLSMLKTDESCSGVSDATITANASGGTSTAYFYNWFRNGAPTGDVTPVITGRNAGWYRVVVTDAGATNCTITDSIEVEVTGTASVAPTAINVINNNTCQGTSKTLTVTGGSLGSGASWKWYLDAAYTVSAGPDGVTLTVDPAVTTTYYVRAEGDCNTTSGVNAVVTVEEIASPVISGDTEVCTPAEATYSVVPEAGMSYLWVVSGGTITGSDTGTEVTVSWTGTVAGTVEVTATSGSGCSAGSVESITKHATPVVGDIVSDGRLTRR